MACSETCSSADGLFQYVFEDSLSTHQSARMSCNNRGWTLATNLTLEDYQILDNCCNTTKTYRIGLVKHQRCNQDSGIRYSWFTSQSCNDGSPLNITGIIPELCQAVAIPVGKLNDIGYNVRLSNCSNRLPYICQKNISTTVPQASIVATPSPTTLFAGASATTPQTAIDGATLPTALSAGTISGIIVGCLLVLLIIFILAIGYFKKHSQTYPKSKPCFECCLTNSNVDEKQENYNVYDR